MSSQSLVEKSCTEVIDIAEERFQKIAPPGIDFLKEKGFALQLLENSDYLKKVATENKVSLLQAITNVAAIGLSLNPAKKQAYLIPRSIKSGNGYETRIFLEVGYMGLCDVATASGCVEWIQSEVVYEKDNFVLNGISKEPTHERDPFLTSEERGAFKGVYCVAKLPNGEFLTTTINAEKIQDIKGRSELGKKDKGPWKTDFEEQAKKTAVRRASKMWPHTKESQRMAEAVEISNKNEGFEEILSNPEMTQYTADQKEYFNQLIEASDAIGMFCFMKSIPEGVYMALYNSFSSEITKFKRIVGELEKNGAAQVNECKQAVEEAAGNDDDLGVREVMEELSTEAVNFILDKTDDDTRKFIQGLGE